MRQSVLISAMAASEYANNTEAELYFVPEELLSEKDNKVGRRPRYIRVPAAAHTCSLNILFLIYNLNNLKNLIKINLFFIFFNPNNI